MVLKFETNRLHLRLFELSDAKTVQVLAGNEKVASTTLSIPHPYPDGAAKEWIERTRQAAENGYIYAFAMVRREDKSLIGCMTLRVTKDHNHGELAYWVGQPFWRQGFATESSPKDN